VQLLKNFPAFYGTRRFIAVFTKPSTVAILSQTNPIHTIPFYTSKIDFNIVNPPTYWSSLSAPSFYLSQDILYAFLISPIRATYPANLILLDLLILLILGEECKLWSV
jgi:hypothetical protein